MLNQLKKGDIASVDVMRNFIDLISHSEYGKEANVKLVAEFIDTINGSNIEKLSKELPIIEEYCEVLSFHDSRQEPSKISLETIIF